MNKQELMDLLKVVIKKLNGADFSWRLEGSANLLIQGVLVEVRDLDITTNKEGLDVFRRLLKEFILKDFFSEKTNGQVILCEINGFEVEINAYGDRPLEMLDRKKIIKWKGLDVPILPLQFALEYYKLIKREDKIKLIEYYLSKQGQN
jgi:hypothetical protein